MLGEAGIAHCVRGLRVLSDRYQLVERLGVGGMSVVWRGYDEVLGRQVAVKLLSAGYAEDAASRDRTQPITVTGYCADPPGSTAAGLAALSGDRARSVARVLSGAGHVGNPVTIVAGETMPAVRTSLERIKASLIASDQSYFTSVAQMTGEMLNPLADRKLPSPPEYDDIQIYRDYPQFDKPLGFRRVRGAAATPQLENFTRVETFGAPNHHWVQVFVRRDDPNVFSFRQRIVAPNVMPR